MLTRERAQDFVLNQGGDVNRATRLGNAKDAKTTISRSGCLLTMFTIAHNLRFPEKIKTVAEVNELCRKGGAFADASLLTEKAAKLLGFASLDREAFSMADLHKELTTPSATIVIVGVDYRPGRSSGFSQTDHFLGAFAIEGGVVHYMDPNGGKIEEMAVAPDGACVYHGHAAHLAETIAFRI